MTTIDVIDASGAKSGRLELPAEIFDAQVNIPLMHQVVTAQLAAARQGTHATKSRGEVAGGGRKPYRQKGTGRARQGSIRAPQFTGGGIVHGPTPHGYAQRTPKKMKAAALRGALSDRAREGRVHVVTSLVEGDTPSTKSAVATLAKVTDRPRVLVVLGRADDVSWLSVRNLDAVHVLTVDQLNTYDVLLSDDVVFTRSAFDTFVAGPATGRSVKAVATSTEVTEQSEPITIDEDERGATDEEVQTDTEVETPYGPGSAAPLEDGSAPDGFTVKGNKDTMRYHEPGGRWYDHAASDVWFASAEDAERAGFAKAGTRAKADSTEEEGK